MAVRKTLLNLSRNGRKRPGVRRDDSLTTAPSRSTYVTPSNVVYYGALVEDAEAGHTIWSISRHARCGDRVLLYVCAPVKAIVAVATLASDPEVLDEPANEWNGTYMAAMDGLRLLNAPITRDILMATFPGWGYWTQPHRSARVKEQYLPALEKLLEAA